MLIFISGLIFKWDTRSLRKTFACKIAGTHYFKHIYDFMWHWQTVLNQIRRHRMRRLIMFCTVCLQSALKLFKVIVNYYLTTLTLRMNASNSYGRAIPLGINGFNDKPLVM